MVKFVLAPSSLLVIILCCYCNLLLSFVGAMDGFGSSYSWNGDGWQTIPPGSSNNNEIHGSNSNVIPNDEGGFSNHCRGDVPNDPAQRRRAANRQYSETYRRKKLEHVHNLEDLEKSLNATLSDSTPQLGYNWGIQSHFVTEGSSLAQTYYAMSSNYQYVEADIEIMASELKEQKLWDEVYEALKPELKKYQGK